MDLCPNVRDAGPKRRNSFAQAAETSGIAHENARWVQNTVLWYCTHSLWLYKCLK